MKELALHMLDIAENSLSAGASQLKLVFEKFEKEAKLILRIEDNGKGMSEEMLKKSKDPFFTSRTTRKVGLGIPLLAYQAELTGGYVEVYSKVSEGTVTEALFFQNHPDIQPLGDIEGCWWILASGNPSKDIVLLCKTEKGEYSISSFETMKVLGVDHLYGLEMGKQLKRLIRNNLEDLDLFEKYID